MSKLERDYTRLKEEGEILISQPVLVRMKGEVFTFIDQNREELDVGAMCRVHYGVTRSGYDGWRRRLSGKMTAERVFLTLLSVLLLGSGKYVDSEEIPLHPGIV